MHLHNILMCWFLYIKMYLKLCIFTQSLKRTMRSPLIVACKTWIQDVDVWKQEKNWQYDGSFISLSKNTITQTHNLEIVKFFRDLDKNTAKADKSKMFVTDEIKITIFKKRDHYLKTHLLSKKKHTSRCIKRLVKDLPTSNIILLSAVLTFNRSIITKSVTLDHHFSF